MAPARLFLFLMVALAPLACAVRPAPRSDPAVPTARSEAPATRVHGPARPQAPGPPASPGAPPGAATLPKSGSGKTAAGRRPVLRVGLLFPEQGPRREIGVEARRGAELCLEDPQGLRPFLLEGVARDEARDADPAALVAGLADREGVIAVIGPLLSDTVRRALPAAERRSLPVISPTAAAGRLGEGSRVFFRTCQTLESYAAALAGFAVGRLGSPTFAVIAPAEAYGRSLAAAFGPAVEQRGGRVVLVREYAPGLRELVPWASALAGELRRPAAQGGGWAVDALFLAASAPDAGLILPRLAYLGLDPRHVAVVGASALNVPDFPRLAGGYAEGALFADGFFAGSSRPAARAFARRYRERHGTDPGAAAAQACAAIEVLAAALEGGAETPARALAALGALGEVPTVLGPIRLTAGGGVERQPFFIAVSGGKLKELDARPVAEGPVFP